MAQRKRMVNNQTSQYEVREILQLSLPIDQPVPLVFTESTRFCLVVAMSVRCLLFVPFSCDSPRGAKQVPGDQSRLPQWHQCHEKMYIKKCASLQLKVPRRGEGVFFFFAKKPLGGSGDSNGSAAAAAAANDADEGGGSPKRWASFKFGR